MYRPIAVLVFELMLCACVCVHARMHMWVRAHIYIISYAYMYDTYIMHLIYNTCKKVYVHRPAAIEALIGVTADAACGTQCVHTHTHTHAQTYTHTCTCILLYVRVLIITDMVYTTHLLPSKHWLGLELMLRVLQSAYTHTDKHIHTHTHMYSSIHTCNHNIKHGLHYRPIAIAALIGVRADATCVIECIHTHTHTHTHIH